MPYHKNRLTFRLALSLCCLLAFVPTVHAEGTYLAGTWGYGPFVRAGFLTGDPEFSLVNPSPFVFLDYDGVLSSDHLVAEYQTGLGQAFIDYRNSKWFHLSALSESTGLAANLPLRENMSVSLGASQAALLSFSLSPDINGSLGFNGVQVELFPGGQFLYRITPQVELHAGYGVQMDLNPEDIQNLDYHHYAMEAWQQCFWLQGGFQDGYRTELRYQPGRDQNTYQAGLKKQWGQSIVGLQAEMDDSLQPIIENHRTLSTGVAFPAMGCILTLNLAYDLVKAASENDFHPQWQMSMRADMPLGNAARSLTFADQRCFGNPDHYSVPDIQDASTWDNAFSKSVIHAILGNDFKGFLTQIKRTVQTPQQLLAMAAILSDNLYYYNYADYQKIYDSFVGDSPENEVTDEEIFNALKKSLASDQSLPVSYCQGFSRLICDITRSLNLQGVEPYMAVVSYQGFPHVIPLVSSRDQIYIVDYGRIIPTGTHDLRTALQTYDNLYSYPLFANFLYDKNGRLIRPVYSQDAELLRETLTVVAPPGPEPLQELFGKMRQ